MANWNRSKALLLCLLLVGCLPPQPSPVTPDKPANTFGLENTVPQTMERADAVQLASVCDEYARQIELDGQQSEPVIQSTKDLEARMAKMQQYAFAGRAVATSGFVEAVNSVQEREFPQGEEAAPVTPELRKKAVEFYQAIAYSLRLSK